MRLIETLKIEDGVVYNLKWHNRRCNRSRLELFGEKSSIDLRDHIVNYPKSGLFRCRILYSRDVISVEYIPYTIKRAISFIVVESDIDYSYKFEDREELNRLRDSYREYGDTIIEKDGLLTDTTIANIAFFDGREWVTPKRPLLYGTTREKLIEERLLVEKDIESDKLQHFSHYALMNAMIGFQIQENTTIYIDKKRKYVFR